MESNDTDSEARTNKLQGQEVETAWLKRLQAGNVGYPFGGTPWLLSLILFFIIGLGTNFLGSAMLVCLVISLTCIAYSSWADRSWRRWKHARGEERKAWEPLTIALTIGQVCAILFMLTITFVWAAAIRFLGQSQPTPSDQILVVSGFAALFGISGG